MSETWCHSYHHNRLTCVRDHAKKGRWTSMGQLDTRDDGCRSVPARRRRVNARGSESAGRDARAGANDYPTRRSHRPIQQRCWRVLAAAVAARTSMHNACLSLTRSSRRDTAPGTCGPVAANAVRPRLTRKESDRVRVSIERGRPYGEGKSLRETVRDLGLEQTVRPEGRPRKTSQSATEATS